MHHEIYVCLSPFDALLSKIIAKNTKQEQKITNEKV